MDRAIARATEEAVEPKAKSRRRRRTAGVPPADPVNEPLAFITFIAAHPLGSEVVGTVLEFSSHGAFVTADGARCYLPLSAMGDPPPRRAREVVTKGEERTFVIQALDPQRRGIELALPGFAKVAGGPTDETVDAEIHPRAEAVPKPRRREKAEAAAGDGTPIEGATPTLVAVGQAPAPRSAVGPVGASPAAAGPEATPVRRAAGTKATAAAGVPGPASAAGPATAPAAPVAVKKSAPRRAPAVKKAAADQPVTVAKKVAARATAARATTAEATPGRSLTAKKAEAVGQAGPAGATPARAAGTRKAAARKARGRAGRPDGGDAGEEAKKGPGQADSGEWDPRQPPDDGDPGRGHAREVGAAPEGTDSPEGHHRQEGHDRREGADSGEGGHGQEGTGFRKGHDGQEGPASPGGHDS